jgi:catechol 2,3-dioxygenase-like lactoylglutathione lyase family enzyme
MVLEGRPNHDWRDKVLRAPLAMANFATAEGANWRTPHPGPTPASCRVWALRLDRGRWRHHISGMLSIAPMIACVPVTDLARARKFYEEKLGLVPRAGGVGAGLVYECGEGSTFFMYVSAGAGTSKANQAFWSVEDLDAEMAELRAKGLEFEEYDLPGLKTVNGVNKEDGMKTAWFKDSEGNILALSQHTRL